MMYKAIAIITARGGSKRIPKKNIRDFCGKPIIAYSIETAINSSVFDEVMVSTDNTDISEIAKKYGAKVPFFRSQKNSDDYATTTDVLLEVLEQYNKIEINPKYICCIYPTAPFIKPEIIKSCMSMLEKSGANMVFPVIPFSYPPQRGLIYDGEYVTMKNPEYAQTRSQDLEKIYHDCGQFYCINVELFLKTKNYMEGRLIPYFMEETEVQDIDNEVDWELAELKYRQMVSKR